MKQVKKSTYTSGCWNASTYRNKTKSKKSVAGYSFDTTRTKQVLDAADKFTLRAMATVSKVISQGLTAAKIKMTVFWDDAPCSFAEIDRRIGGSWCAHHSGGGGSKHRWNVGQFLRGYTAHSPRRLSHLQVRFVRAQLMWRQARQCTDAGVNQLENG
jgi:hypothetical protein